MLSIGLISFGPRQPTATLLRLALLKHPMEFYSFNFRLLVINELIELGLLDEQLATIYDKQRKGHYEKYYEELESGGSGDDEWDDDFDDFFDDGTDDYYNPHPEMEEEVAAVELTAELLSRIEKLDLDYGEIQGMLAPHWHGEDELFEVRDLRDVLLLPNLKHVHLSFALASEIKSLAPLLDVPKLERVTTVSTLSPDYFFENDPKTKTLLLEKGVKVTKGK
jgi:hypothetical protein